MPMHLHGSARYRKDERKRAQVEVPGPKGKSVELVDDPVLVARILLALGLYGRAPARAPPRAGGGLFDDMDQRYAADD